MKQEAPRGDTSKTWVGICCLSLTHSAGVTVTERNTVGRHLDKVKIALCTSCFRCLRRKEQNRIKLIVASFITGAKPKVSKNCSQVSPCYPLPHGRHEPSLLPSLLSLSLGTPSTLAVWTSAVVLPHTSQDDKQHLWALPTTEIPEASNTLLWQMKLCPVQAK